MGDVGQLRAGLGAALTDGRPGLAAADRLCVACVDLLHVDGASISLMHEGQSRGTFGSSSALSRELDDLQFTYGEGPCMEAVTLGRPVLVADLDDLQEQRWPAFTGAVLATGIRAVYALPVLLASSAIGALDLFSRRPGELVGDDLDGALWAAELSGLPLLDLMSGAASREADSESDRDGWEQLATLNRVEIHQATGMIIAALDVDRVTALVMLRAHAMAEGRTASECAWAIVERRTTLGPGGIGSPADSNPGEWA